jgi:hypothetical protein
MYILNVSGNETTATSLDARFSPLESGHRANDRSGS